MARTKRYFYDRIVLGLQDAHPNIDWKIQPREVFLAVDDIVNAMAKDNFFENWKLGTATIDDQFTTTWSGDTAIAVVDPTDQLSYLLLPAQYAALPMNRGIDEIWPENYEYGSVKIMQSRDIRLYKNNMAGSLQGELGGFPQGIRFTFNQPDVGKNFAPTFGMRLVIKDSSQISETAPYPVPGSAEEEIIKRGILFFSEKRIRPTDVIRDRNDSVNRN
jgi:hypothetical protein